MLTPRRYAGDLFSEMRRLQSEMDRLFQPATPISGAEFPLMNVYASQSGVAVTAELPGVSEDQLEITVHRDTVTLRGERPVADEKAKAFHRRERTGGKFVRTLSLPFSVDPERVEAEMRNGVLRLSLPRPESDKPKQVKIKTS